MSSGGVGGSAGDAGGELKTRGSQAEPIDEAHVRGKMATPGYKSCRVNGRPGQGERAMTQGRRGGRLCSLEISEMLPSS